MGYGVIMVLGNTCELISAGVLKLNKTDHHLDRLKLIFETVSELIAIHHPDECALEEPFYGKNVQSMLKLGRAQGMAMAAALNRHIPVFGYSPRLIKQSITGKGGASKEQVAAMIQRILRFEQVPQYLDATDAVGVALCHYFQTGNAVLNQTTASRKSSVKIPSGKKTKSDWGAFIRENPGRTTS
jgi:crossover junction endodeoxyribonuclease RuvC